MYYSPMNRSKTGIESVAGRLTSAQTITAAELFRIHLSSVHSAGPVGNERMSGLISCVRLVWDGGSLMCSVMWPAE